MYMTLLSVTLSIIHIYEYIYTYGRSPTPLEFHFQHNGDARLRENVRVSQNMVV